MLENTQQTKKETEIFLVRHGETFAKTTNNPVGAPFVCGSGSEVSRNTHLTDAGKEGMFKVGQNYEGVQFDAVIVSDLIRSRESAEAFLEGAGLPSMENEIIVDPRITEINYGEDDGVAEEIVKEKKKKFFAENPQYNGDLSFAFPGAESFKSAGERMRNAISDISKQYAGKKVLIISHSGAMRAFTGNVVPGKDLKFGEVIKIKGNGENLELID